MVGKITLYLATFGWVLSAAAQAPPPPKSDAPAGKQPRLVVPERNRELGNVAHGDVVPLSWTLRNEGEANLVIDRTVAACGCTVMQLGESQKVIPPGGTLDLTGEFRSVGRKGEQIKTVVVHSNDPVEPQIELQFHARVEVLYEMNPPLRWVIRGLRRGQTAGDTLDITPGEGKLPIELLDAKLKDAGLFTLKSELLPTPAGNGHRFRLASTDIAPLGNLTTSALLKLKIGDREKEVEVPINVEIVVDINAQPKIVAPSAQENLPGGRLAPVVIRSLEKRPFEILGVNTAKFLDVTIEPAADKSSKTEYHLSILLREDAPPGPFGTTLEVRTDSISQPVIKVPVFGTVAPSVHVDPPVIVLRQDGTPEGGERRVKVQGWPDTVLDIASVKSEHAAAAVTLVMQEGPVGNNVRYLSAKLTGKVPPGTHNAKVVLTTNARGAEVIEIPLIIEGPK